MMAIIFIQIQFKTNLVKCQENLEHVDFIFMQNEDHFFVIWHELLLHDMHVQHQLY